MKTTTLPALYSDPVTPARQILLAEDSDDLREVMTACLTMSGYNVIACQDGQEAFDAFHAGQRIDLLLTDIEMPRKSGLDLARDLTAFRSSLPVLIVSGSLISASVEQEMRVRKWGLLSKPHAMPQLLDELERCLRPQVECSSSRANYSKASAEAREVAKTKGTNAGGMSIISVRLLKEGGMKVDLSDATCVFLTLAQLIASDGKRQPQSAAWPSGVELEYCCYDGCARCSPESCDSRS